MPSKCLLFQLPIALEYQTWNQIYAKVQPFYLMIKYTKYLIIIFININENIRNERNHRKNGGVSTKLLLSQLPLITNFQTKPTQFCYILLFAKQIISFKNGMHVNETIRNESKTCRKIKGGTYKIYIISATNGHIVLNFGPKGDVH